MSADEHGHSNDQIMAAYISTPDDRIVDRDASDMVEGMVEVETPDFAEWGDLTFIGTEGVAVGYGMRFGYRCMCGECEMEESAMTFVLPDALWRSLRDSLNERFPVGDDPC